MNDRERIMLDVVARTPFNMSDLQDEYLDSQEYANLQRALLAEANLAAVCKKTGFPNTQRAIDFLTVEVDERGYIDFTDMPSGSEYKMPRTRRQELSEAYNRADTNRDYMAVLQMAMKFIEDFAAEKLPAPTTPLPRFMDEIDAWEASDVLFEGILEGLGDQEGFCQMMSGTLSNDGGYKALFYHNRPIAVALVFRDSANFSLLLEWSKLD